MIRYLTRKQIDVEKYDTCIEKSVNSRIYAFSWYLDIVADNWSVLVRGDYEAVMPLPFRKKFGFVNYVYPPFWVLELGVFSVTEINDEIDLLKAVKKKFWFVETRLNYGNGIKSLNKKSKVNQYQILSLKKGEIEAEYKSDRKKDLRRANKNGLFIEKNNSSKMLIDLFKSNVGVRIPNIISKDYNCLKNLIDTCIKKGKGELLNVFDKENKLVASGFFLLHQKEVIILVSSTDFKNRKNGANTFLIHHAIQRYKNQFEVFNFGGSSMSSIAKYFLSFGASTREYLFLKQRLF